MIPKRALTLVAVVGFKMEKLEEFNPDQQSLEDWIEAFEARAACTGNVQGARKVQWCRSVIGSVGRKIF